MPWSQGATTAQQHSDVVVQDVQCHLETNHDTHALVDCLLRQPGTLWHLRQESAGRQLRSVIQRAHVVD